MEIPITDKIWNFPYTNLIKTPNQMNPNTEYDSHIKNIKNYVYLLLKGKGPASKINNNYIGNNLESELNSEAKYYPLGFNYLLDTKTVCKDISSNTNVPRSLYINNVIDKPEFGLINDYRERILKIKDNTLYNSLKDDEYLYCKKVSLKSNLHNEYRTNFFNEVYDSGYLTLQDIQDIDPCLFINKKNPSTNKNCSLTEGYKNFMDTDNDNYTLFESEYIIQLRNLYFVLLILLFSYVVIKKSKN